MIAADVMTENPRTILESDSVGDALEVLATLDIRHLPVVDGSDTLVGMLSDRDLAPLMRNFDAASRRKLSEYMSSDVVSVDEDTDLRDVIETLLEQHIGAVPVVDGDGKVTGIISYVDLLRTYAGELEPDAKKASGATKKAKPKGKVAKKKAKPAAPKKKAKPAAPKKKKSKRSR